MDMDKIRFFLNGYGLDMDVCVSDPIISDPILSDINTHIYNIVYIQLCN